MEYRRRQGETVEPYHSRSGSTAQLQGDLKHNIKTSFAVGENKAQDGFEERNQKLFF